MRLKNKKTGQEGNFIINKDHFECVDLDCVPLYFSLSELLEEWEDCTPKEPLIKDEKVRKAVRAWAEANEVLEVFIDRIGDGTYIELYDEDDGRRRISTLRPVGLKIGEAYTIDELCGEEEE